MKNRNIEHSDNWQTPKEFYDKLNEIYKFDFDPCPICHDGNLEFDGLTVDWGMSNFVNPPYSRQLKEKFVIKGIEESKSGKICVFLLPVSTSTKLFHEHILPNAKKIEFVKGRIKFIGYNTKGEQVSNKCGMHDSMIVVFGGE